MQNENDLKAGKKSSQSATRNNVDIISMLQEEKMSNPKAKITFLNQLILNNELNYEDKCGLLTLIKDIQFGTINYSNGLKSTQLYSFYNQYISDICFWLSEPLDSIHAKIKDGKFTELENKLILTNILIKIRREHDDEKLP